VHSWRVPCGAADAPATFGHETWKVAEIILGEWRVHETEVLLIGQVCVCVCVKCGVFGVGCVWVWLGVRVRVFVSARVPAHVWTHIT